MGVLIRKFLVQKLKWIKRWKKENITTASKDPVFRDLEHILRQNQYKTNPKKSQII